MMPTSVLVERHLVPLTGEWGIWRSACLRSAGFPIERVLALAAPASSELLLEHLRLEHGEQQCRAALLAEVRQELRRADRDRRAELNRARKDLQKARVPRLAGASPRIAALVASYRDAAQRRAEMARAAGEIVARDLAEQRLALRRFAADPRVHEAMLWQNRHAVGRVRPRVLSSGAASARDRRDELLIVSYAQRFCTKNETVGFFGPLCWLTLRPEHTGLAVSAGPSLVRDAFVQFETWVLDAVARAWESRFDLRRWLRPRRVPLIRLDGPSLVRGDGTREPLSPVAVATLQLADGTRTAETLARQLVADASSEIATVESVFEALRGLQERGWITWRFELPLEAHEQALDEQVRAIGDPAVRAAVLAEWNALRSCRDAAASAAGDPDAVDRVLAQAERTFTRIAGMPATRRAGQTYGTRTLLRQECLRDVDVSAGDDVVAQCGEPLALVLTSARWFTSRVALHLGAELDAVHKRLDTSGSGFVEAAQFWLEFAPRYSDYRKGIKAAVGELHRHWVQVFGPLTSSRVFATTADLRPRVEAAFRGPTAAPSYLRHTSVDLQIAARHLEDVNWRTPLYILGEIHVGNLLDAGLFVDGHPNRSVLRSHLEADCPRGRVLLERPCRPSRSARFSRALQLPRDVLVVVDPGSQAYGERAIPLADCGVERRDGQLVLCRRGGAPIAPLIDAFGALLYVLRAVRFSFFDDADHTPRVTIDNLVICRETWRLDLPLECLREADTARGVIALNRWRLARGLPRWCFARVKTEPKPIYVDFDSSVLSALLLATMRRAALAGASDVTLTEMLPDPTQLWLRDGSGLRYTSEFRLVAVDRLRPHAWEHGASWTAARHDMPVLQAD